MKTRPFVLPCVLLLELLRAYVSHATQTDLQCVESILKSFPDLGLLYSWDLTNTTEGSICMFLGDECWHPEESRVMNIKLQDLDLKGQFPLGITYCTSLTGLYLSGNHLTGSIPCNISMLISFVTTLDLSSNSLSGAIPDSLAYLSFLNTLALDQNHFSGQIPLQLGGLTRLRLFSVAGNNLTGQVPLFSICSFPPAESYANNSGLCGGPLPLCLSPTKKRRKMNDDFIESAGVGFAVGFVLVITFNLFVFNMFM